MPNAGITEIYQSEKKQHSHTYLQNWINKSKIVEEWNLSIIIK